MRSISKLLLMLFFAITLAIANFAQSSKPPNGIKKIVTVEGITEYQLGNGLKVLLIPDQSQPKITVNVTYLVGSRYENYGEAGMAHLLEHLLFKGSSKHPDIPREFALRGAFANATTWTDRTVYYETFIATEENLEWALDLEADRMVNSFVSEKDLRSEFSVVRNELESGENSPLSVLFDRIRAVAFDWHNYSRSTIGVRSDIENVPIQRLKAFYKKYYQPDNAVLIVAGKFDEAKALELVNKKFGTIKKPARKLSSLYTVEPVQDGERMVTIRRIGNAQIVMAGYHVPPAAHPDSAAAYILGEMLTNAPNGKLYENLVKTKKATSIIKQHQQFRDPGYLMFAVQIKKEDSMEDARKVLIETIEDFGKAAPSKEDVERIKNKSLRSFETALNNSTSLPLSLTNYIARGDWRLIFIQRDRIARVTPEDIQRLAKDILNPSNRTIAQFIPTQKPSRYEAPNLSNEELAAVTKNYKGRETVAAGEAFDPTPQNIEARTKRLKIGNLKAAFLTKENRGDRVYARLALRFGNEKSLTNQRFSGDIAQEMLLRGTRKRTRQQINDELDRLRGSIRIGGGAEGIFINIQSTRQNLSATLKLLAEILREPSFAKDDFDEIKRARLNSLESRKDQPRSVVMDAVNKHFNRYPKGHIRYTGSTEEDIEALNHLELQDVKNFYADFYGASNGELAVVGDFNPKQTSKLVEDLFSNWKSPSKYQRVPSKYFDIPPTNVSFETPDKANAYFRARTNVKLSSNHPDYVAMVVVNNLLGGGFLSSRLPKRIREKEGLSYGVATRFRVDDFGDNGSFSASAIYAPPNVTKLENAFREEIQKAILEGFTDKEVEEVKKGILLARQSQRAGDFRLSISMADDLYLGRTFKWDAAFEEKLKSIKTAEVNAALRRYIKLKKFSIFKAGDFAAVKGRTE